METVVTAMPGILTSYLEKLNNHILKSAFVQNKIRDAHIADLEKEKNELKLQLSEMTSKYKQV